MFVCKLGAPSCSHYEHFHVYLAYRRNCGDPPNIRPSSKTKLTAHCTHFKGWLCTTLIMLIYHRQRKYMYMYPIKKNIYMEIQQVSNISLIIFIVYTCISMYMYIFKLEHLILSDNHFIIDTPIPWDIYQNTWSCHITVALD